MVKYKDSEGNYLAIVEHRDGYYIAWYLKEEQEFGTYIEFDKNLPSEPPEELELWQTWAIQKAVAPFASCSTLTGALFEAESFARKALKEANQALLSRKSPWPEWARKAQKAGWTPPEGWTP